MMELLAAVNTSDGDCYNGKKSRVDSQEDEHQAKLACKQSGNMDLEIDIDLIFAPLHRSPTEDRDDPMRTEAGTAALWHPGQHKPPLNVCRILDAEFAEMAVQFQRFMQA